MGSVYSIGSYIEADLFKADDVAYLDSLNGATESLFEDLCV